MSWSSSRAALHPLPASRPGQPARATPSLASFPPSIRRGRLRARETPKVAAAVNRADRDQKIRLGWWWATVVTRDRQKQATSSTGVSRRNRASAWLVVRIWLPKPLGTPQPLAESGPSPQDIGVLGDR